MFEISQLEDALAPLKTAENLCRSMDALDSLPMARVCVGQALVYAHKNQYSTAGPLYERGLKIRQRHLPEDHQLLANSHMQVALYMTSAGRLDEAIASHHEAIRICSKSYQLAPSLMGPLLPEFIKMSTHEAGMGRARSCHG